VSLSYDLERVRYKHGLDVFVQFAECLLNVSVGQFLVHVHVKTGVRVDLHQPDVEVLVHEDVQAQHLKALGVLIVRVDETVVGVLQVGLQGDDRLHRHVLYATLEVPHVLASGQERLVDVGQQTLGSTRVLVKFLYSLSENKRIIPSGAIKRSEFLLREKLVKCIYKFLILL
jgi:hypothetical protein